MGQGRQAGPRADWELMVEVHEPADDVSIVPSVGDQEDHAIDPEVSSLRGDLSLQRLDVVEAGLRLHENGESGPRNDAIGASVIALDRHRYLRSPVAAAAKACPKPPG